MWRRDKLACEVMIVLAFNAFIACGKTIVLLPMSHISVLKGLSG